MTYQTLLKYGLQWVVAISLGAVTAVSIATEQGRIVKDSRANKPTAMRSTIIYKPLLLDVSLAKVSESTRSMGGEAATLQVLAPVHAGLTTQSQPTLYWYTRTPVAVRFELILLDKEGTNPLLEVDAGSKKVAGIQQLDLGDHNISLQPEVAYQWSVALVMDEGSHKASVTASGVIQRMEPGEGLTSRIENNHGTDLVAVYANEGIWYDALDTISSMIAKSPEDQGLVAIRASLLSQVDLHAAAGN
jgi:hypothetical protein